MKRHVLLTAAVLLANAISPLRAAERINFEQQIKPILEFDCVRCHGPEKPKGNLRLDTRAGALKGGDDGTALVPGKPDRSPLYTSTILPTDDDKHMPPKGDPLKKDETELLRQWIEQGAEWPEGMPPLIARKLEAAPAGDEAEVVANIHKLILSRPEVKSEAQMTAYTNDIPGAPVKYGMVPIHSGEFLMGSSIVCRPRPSGSTPAARARPPRIRLETTPRSSATTPGSRRTAMPNTRRSDGRNRIPGVFTTCTATWTSGASISTRRTTNSSSAALLSIRGSGPQNLIRTPCGVVRGMTRRRSFAAQRGGRPTNRGRCKTRSCPRASGIIPTRNSSASAWFGR